MLSLRNNFFAKWLRISNRLAPFAGALWRRQAKQAAALRALARAMIALVECLGPKAFWEVPILFEGFFTDR
jgi:hypothetical protein